MGSTETTLDLVGFLAGAYRAFITTREEASRKPVLHNLDVTIVPLDKGPSEYATDGKVLFLYLNADIRSPYRKPAIGMQFLMRHTEGHWLGEAEIGWSSAEVGWEDFDSRELLAPSIEEFMKKAPDYIEWLANRFLEEIAKLPD